MESDRSSENEERRPKKTSFKWTSEYQEKFEKLYSAGMTTTKSAANCKRAKTFAAEIGADVRVVLVRALSFLVYFALNS